VGGRGSHVDVSRQLRLWCSYDKPFETISSKGRPKSAISFKGLSITHMYISSGRETALFTRRSIFVLCGMYSANAEGERRIGGMCSPDWTEYIDARNLCWIVGILSESVVSIVDDLTYVYCSAHCLRCELPCEDCFRIFFATSARERTSRFPL